MRTPSGTTTAVYCLLIFLAGCRNNTMQSVATTYPQAGFNSLTGSTRVPAPATYSVKIPNTSGSSYYNAAAQLPPANAAITAPSLAASSQPPVLVGSNSTMTTISSGPSVETPDSIPQTKTVSLEAPPVNNTLPPSRVAQNTLPPTGLSYTNHTNFRSTAVDERQDQTRLPVTDASQVRAPTNFSNTATGGQNNYPYYPPPQTQPVGPQYPYSPGSPYQAGANNNAAGPNVVRGSFSQPVFAQPSQQPYSGVSTQSTPSYSGSSIYADPSQDPNIQNGWSNGN